MDERSQETQFKSPEPDESWER